MHTDYKKNKIKDSDRLVSRHLKERRLMLESNLKEIEILAEAKLSVIRKYEKYPSTIMLVPRVDCPASAVKTPLYYLCRRLLFALCSLKRKSLILLKFLVK